MTLNRKTRADIVKLIKNDYRQWTGQLNELDFLSGAYDLENMPSHDLRFENAYQDILQHTVFNPGDWADDWFFHDSRFDIMNGPEEEFLRFLCEILNPNVQPDEKKRMELLKLLNEKLSNDDLKIEERTGRFGNKRYEITGIVPTSLQALNELKDTAETLNLDFITDHIRRIENNMTIDPAVAIGSSKDLLESVCKNILSKRGTSLNGTENMNKLAYLTIEQLKSTMMQKTGIPDGIIKKISSSVITIAQCVGEVRNSYGTGHGRDSKDAGLLKEYAKLAANTSSALALFFYELNEK